MKTILTAEEFMDNQGINEKELQNLPWFDYGNLLTWLEDYSNLKAKFHVEVALKEALESIPCLGSSSDIATYEEVRDAVLNAYPLTLIK